MGLISILNLVSFLALLAAFILLLTGQKHVLKRDTRLLFAGYMILQLIYSIGNFLLWAGITGVLDRYEEYVVILVPVLWISFFYTFLRHRTEDALREGAEKYRRMEANIPGMVYIYALHPDGSHSFPYVTSESRELFNLEPEDVIRDGTLLSGLIHPDDKEIRDESIRISAETLQPWRQELRHIVNGRMRWYDCMSRPERQSNGDILWDGIILEITDRKLAEKALRNTEIEKTTILENMSDLIVYRNRDMEIIWASKSAADWHGTTSEEIKGRVCYKARYGRDESCENCYAIEAMISGERREFDTQSSDGKNWHVTINPVKDSKGRVIGTIEVSQDITERKITEQKLLEDQAQLKSLASQLSVTEERERRRLATELHDHIGQSLIISKIKLDALRRSDSSNEIPDVLNEVCKYLGQVIQDVRTLTFDLSSPILYELGFEAAVSEWLSDQIQNEYGIETEFEDDEQEKPLDDDIRALMFRNVRELLINVVKHAEARKVKVTTNRVNEHIEVTVEDDGIGFDPVRVVSMATQKSKFGLFSIRERLDKLGGNIEIESKSGQGSKITMKAPLKFNN